MDRLRKLQERVGNCVWDRSESRRQNITRWFVKGGEAFYLVTMVVFVVTIEISRRTINHVLWPPKPPKKGEKKRS